MCNSGSCERRKNPWKWQFSRVTSPGVVAESFICVPWLLLDPDTTAAGRGGPLTQIRGCVSSQCTGHFELLHLDSQHAATWVWRWRCWKSASFPCSVLKPDFSCTIDSDWERLRLCRWMLNDLRTRARRQTLMQISCNYCCWLSMILKSSHV